MWLSGRQLVGWILGVGLVCGQDYQDEETARDAMADQDNQSSGSVESIEEANQSAESVELFEDKKGQDDKDVHILLRPEKPVGTLSDDDYLGHNDKNYDFNAQKKQKSFGHFRSSSLKSRGSKVSRNTQPKSIPHQPFSDDPQGCGNPICVVIDRKPRRFKSICAYSKFACDNSRKNQMNFIQKGDCYDIIDNKEGAKDKPWTPPDLDLGDCSECKNHEYCKKPITVNIDLKNLLLGESSAFGGPSFNEQNAQQGRMVGVPIEFENVCALNKYFKTNENLNIKTQVIGIAIGTKKEIFPLDENSNKCLWTEWFDHDTPCNSDGDDEMHSDHQNRLMETYTGPLRICMPQEMGDTSQHEGGSEITQVSAIDAKKGEALGFLKTPFEQVIDFSQIQISCSDEKQTIPELPAPFIFGEGIKGNPNKNATCLDYKIRYCCKSNKMYRPTEVNYFQNYIPPKLPIGPAKSEIKVETDGSLKKMNMTVFPIQGDAMGQKIAVSFNGGNGKKKKCTVLIDDGATEVIGEYMSRQTNGGMEIIIELKLKSEQFGKLILISGSGGEVTSTEIQTNKGTKAVSVITTGGGGGGDGGDGGGKLIKTIITDKKGGKMEIVCHYNGKKIKTVGEVALEGRKGSQVWEGLSALNQELNVEYFIESPPLATIFAECEWKDWVNTEYPDKRRTGQEWEMRTVAHKIRKWRKHVCGNIPEKAHYIDAVKMEDGTPWYELMVGEMPYEVYKLSPFHGYICNDANMPGNEKFCQDMKVRYCCAKRLRAQWSKWQEWSECTKTCGAGTRKRIKKCVQSDRRQKGSGLYQVSYNPLCVGEESKQKRKQVSEMTENCNIEGCPVDFQWQAWSQWSSCSVSCNDGTKTRSRICSPAISGGGECPDKRKEKDLYYEEKECTKSDCEIFYEGPWCAWSTCSVTCGQGMKARNRKCYSNTTLQVVSNNNCANEKSHFNQEIKCKMPGCPVDGGWSTWQEWSSCDQDCVDHPESGGKRKAKRTRRRWCNDPIMKYGGKKCKKDPKYKWVSHERAEMDTTECVTLLNKKPGEKHIQWCPVNCVLTEWTEWSVCSQTCVVSPDGPTVNYKGPYKTGTGATDRQGKNIYMVHPRQPTVLPKRERIRQIYVKEKYGGVCITESFQERRKDDNENLLRQSEDCPLCKEHCPTVNGPKLVDFKKLPYPHPDNPKCVGYCPVDCKWKNGQAKQDCKKEIEDYFKETNYGKGKYSYKNGCFLSKVVKTLDKNKMTESQAFVKDLEAIIEKIKKTKGKRVRFKPKAEEQPSLANIYNKYEEGEDVYEQIWEEVSGDFDEDFRKLKKLLLSETEKWAEVPVLDGLYGGTQCQRKHPDNRLLTVRQDDDSKYDKKTMTNGPPREYSKSWDLCDINVCNPIIHETEPGPGDIITPCEHFMWSEWGNWGKCDLKCGPEGSRKRHRKCMNNCKDEEVSKEKCKPYINNIMNKTFTDVDRTMCTPCPANEQSMWSEWGEWSLVQGEKCGSGVRKEERRRACAAGKDGTKKCEGKDTETKEYKLNPCPENAGGGNSEYNYGAESEGGMEDGQNPGTDEGANDDGGMVVNDNDGAEGEYPGAAEDRNGEDGADADNGMDPGGEGEEDTYPGADGEGAGEGDAGGDGGDATYPGGGQEVVGGDGAAGEDGEDGTYPGTGEPEDSNMGEYIPEVGTDYADEYDTTESEDYN